MSKIQAQLNKLGIKIPSSNPPAANYIPFKQIGNIIYVSGQTAKLDGIIKYAGTVGVEHDIETAYKAARLCAMNVLSQVNLALQEDLVKVKSCVKMNVYINCLPDFKDHAKIADGASDLIIEIFEEKGIHARSVMGFSSLPTNSLIEVEAIFEVDNA